MEEEFAKLLEQVRAEFPGYRITMGIGNQGAIGDELRPGTWFIELESKSVKCGCCGVARPERRFSTYLNPTFAAAVADLRARVPK